MRGPADESQSQAVQGARPVESRASAGQGGEPIAVVGMACRFPRAPSVVDFWRLLEAGESGVIEGVPGSGVGRIGELFPTADVQSEGCRFGAYLDDIDLFDAPFFRISPVEAQLLDPQQRLMLETSWRALEDAGIDPDGCTAAAPGSTPGSAIRKYRELTQNISETAGPAASLYAVSGTSFTTRPLVASPSRWACRDRQWRWTPPARHRWLRFIRRWPAAAGRGGPGAGGRGARDAVRSPDRASRQCPDVGAPTDGARRSTPPPTGMCGAKVAESWC